MKRVIFLSFVLLGVNVSYGQLTGLSNTLLWRISGKGLTKPSYLYGTIHLTDKRVFQFGDSLYMALEQADGFAAELDMNRLGMQMINYMIADREAKAAKEPVKVKDAVSEEVWERYKKQLQDRFYKPADKVTVNDLEEVESALQADLFRKGDMPTFLDAYLFGMARKQGKWVGGLEELQDQIEHINNAEDIEGKIQMAIFDDKYYRSGIERLIKMYTAQLLDSIDAYLYREENGQKDYIMIKRNLKMVKMMDSLSTVRSTFFAVGAAHLPGDSGVITLLRKNGFTVSPVISRKKISPDKYAYKSKETPWQPVAIKDSAYSLQMPGLAENMDVFASIGIDMKMFFDISFMKMYMTMGLELPEERRKLGADSLYNGMRNRYGNRDKLPEEKRITVNGMEGREYTMTTEDGELKLQVFIPGLERLILNAVFAFNKKVLDDDESGRFFKSFVYNGVAKKGAETEKAWIIQRYPHHSFTVEMPLKPRERKDVNSQEGKIIYTYQTIDIRSQVFYGMNISAVKKGLYDSGLDSNYFLSLKENLKAGFEDSKIIDSSFITINNYPGYRLSVTGKAKGDIVETKVLALARGSRSYYLYAVFFPNDENRLSAERFLRSFTILPYDLPEWKTITSPDGSFTTISPLPIKAAELDENDIHEGSERFIVYDSIVSATTYIDRTLIPEWCWFPSDTAFLRQRTSIYKAETDSIADYKVVLKGNQAVADFVVLSPARYLVKKVKLVLNGRELFELFGHYDPHDIAGLYDKFFGAFKAENKNAAVNWSGSRIKQLAELLEKSDREEAGKVKQWWNSLQFTQDDLPVLQKMLLRVYPDFDSVYQDNVNARIFEKVEELDSTYTTLDYIKANYRSIQLADEYIKPFIITYLSGVKTAGSYTLLKDVLINYPFGINEPIYFRHSLYDSFRLTASLFPEIMKYADSEALGGLVLGLAVSLLDSGLVNKNMIRQNSKGFINYIKKRLDINKEDIEENGYSYYNHIQVLGVINSPQSNSLLSRFSKFNNRGLRFKTLIAQLKNDQPVDSRTIYTLATTDEYRHELYDELKKIGKQKLFPTQYLSQKEFGKSKLYEYVNGEEFPLITYAGEKVALYKGRQQKFYLYKLSFSDFKTGPYLAIAGPYSLNGKDCASTHEATGVYWKAEFDAKYTDTFFKEYLLSLEEPAGEESEPETSPFPLKK